MESHKEQSGNQIATNIVLNTLNLYGFGKMVETIKKRFQEKPGGRKKAAEKEEGVMVEGLMDSSTLITEIVDDVDGSTVFINGDIAKGKMEASIENEKSIIEVEQTEVRRRRKA